MAAPELRLNVTLDLASFRSQLGKLAQTAATYYYPVNLIIDKKNFEAQLKALGKIKPVINIKDDQLIAAKTRIGTLNKSLATLRRATATPIEIKVKYVEEGKPPTGAISKSGTFRQRLTGLDTEPIKQLYAAAGKAGIVQFDAEIAKNKGKIITALNQAGESSVTGLLNGLKSKDSAVKAAAKSLGDILIAALKLSLQIQSPSKRMEAIGEDAGDGFNKGLKESLSEAKNSAVTEMRELVAALKSEAAKIQNISVAPSSLRGTPRRGTGFRALPEGASQAGAGVEFSEMMRRFRGEIAALTTQPQKYEQLLNALPDRKITTDLADVASRRSRAAEMPSFMPIQRQLGPGELEKQITGDVARYLRSIRIPNPWVGPTGDFQKFIGNISKSTKQLGSQLLLPPSNAVKLLPPGSSPTFQQVAAARTQIAYQRSAARNAAVLGEPSAPVGGGGGGGGGGLPPGGGGSVPPTPPSGGGRGGGFFSGMQFNMPKLPGAGIVQGLGTEFAFAAKQVLLFGTAYKALAFLTDFPSQVGSAVGQLQSFRNTLNAVSPSAQEAAQSSQFILDVVDKYNVPLQSARDGFTKLYASMQPAGFGGNEIRDLFLGISQAAATFGMSADKVDRVNYAFAQMASKGQVMSEELKGQLGDVLPGSMALFAEAAGFKGPQAITKFSKALEDGVYKGSAMKTLLTNVGIVMRKEFGPGAEGAAKTFQGSINRMQNSLKLFYETFEPVAVGFLNAVVMPMTSGIKTLTDGFNAFFAGQAAQTAGGNALAQQLEQLRPAFDGIRNNIAQILPLLQSFGKTALSLGSILLQIAGNPFVGYLARVYLAVLPLTIAIQALNLSALIPLIRNLLAAVPAFVAFTASQLRGMSTLGSFKAATYGLGLTAAATGVKIRLLSGIIKTAFATTVIGVALLGIGMLIEKLMMAGFKADEAKQKMLQFADSVKQAGKAGDVAGLVTTLAEEKGMTKRMQNAKALLEKIKEGKKSISEQQAQELKALGLTSNMAFFQEGGPKNLSKNLTVQVSMFGVLEANIQAAQQGYLEGQTKIIQTQKALNEAKTKQVEEEKKLEKIKLEGGDGGKAAEREAERQAKLQDKLANRQDQLALEAANRQVALDQSTFDSRLRMSDAEYDHERALQDDYFERKMSGLDSIEARQKKFQQDLQAIENRRIDSIRKAELDAVKAVQDLRSASIKAAAVTGSASGDSSKYVDRSVLRKYLESEGFGRTSGDFTNKGHKTPDHMRNAMDYGIMGGSDADALRKTIAMERKLKATGAFGDQLFGPERDPYGHGAGKGGQNIHLHIPTPDGKIKLTPGLSNLIGGEGLQSSAVGLNTRSGAFAMGRREDKLEGQLAVEQQDAQNKALEKLETIRRANNLALEQTITLVKQNIDSIFPVKEQQLENDLLEMRNNLELKGTSKEIIDMEVQKYKAVKENAHNLQMLNEKIAKNNEELTKLKGKKITTEEEKEQIKFLTDQIKAYKLAITGIPEQQRLFNEQLEKTAALAVESPMVKLAKQLNETKKELIEIGSASSIAIGSAKAIGEAFGNSFKSMISGSATVQQSFASLFQSVGDYFLDMASRIITKYIEMQAIQGLMSIFNMFAPGAAAGGGFALGGPGGQGAAGSYGSAMSPTSSLPSFTGGAGFQPVSMGAFGIQQFASGGIVQGPTLGLVGEGKYNEAIIPLPDGKSVPVDLGGMSDGLGNNITSNIVVNVSSDGQSTSNANGSNSVDLGRKIEGAVKQVIVAELRPGGVLAGRR